MIRNRCFDMGAMNFDATQANMNNIPNDKMNMDNNFTGCNMAPIMECPQERCCHREIHHEVKHVIPVNTRILNHHIIHHTYVPMYTCCEENDCCDVYDNKCCM